MTIQELIDTLMARRRGLGYRMWREAYLISWATMGKNYPRKPENAVPELFPKQMNKTIRMPENLLRKQLENMRRK